MLEEVTYRRKLEFIVVRTLPPFVLSVLMHLHSFYQTHALIELTFRFHAMLSLFHNHSQVLCLDFLCSISFWPSVIIFEVILTF